MNRLPLIIGAVIAVPMIVFLALALDINHDVIESPLIGKPAPGFVLDSFEGDSIELGELEGTPLVVNFWASYCQPCVYEHPLLTAAARDLTGSVNFVGVVPPEDTAEAVDRFTSRLGAWGPTYYDSDGRVSIAYGVGKLPETYFVDAAGTIQHKHAGPLDPQTLATALEKIL
ncbi:MAG: redoxin domain-containing protein [Acidobacteriota bacterium]|nr:redoxin domain-containing protein [Acidobacteriota bacterium]